ncbi:SSE2-like protein [Saccharomyces kudriavzevii IFO 1802]|uniref:SSE2-like protein n=1 Tax=Saccharomyces kudriavzevii (strain ATCC MYA-4449 / AS 2.2408 / CBS 8840 / NBRC 1802 / NCYC 2889) TaxID=226230 RepID=J8TQW6_SACK1|nr:SSE2-like protein [Saccharomyces kudriavzevii IFO 1802]
MSTPFGLDLGNNNSVLAVARNRGIDIVVNEVSNRCTPSLVGFGSQNRYLGESGKTKQTSNVKNTVENLKRIIGLNFKDPEFDIENKFFTSKLVQLKNGKVGAEVKFGGKTQIDSDTTISAMLLYIANATDST